MASCIDSGKCPSSSNSAAASTSAESQRSRRYSGSASPAHRAVALQRRRPRLLRQRRREMLVVERDLPECTALGAFARLQPLGLQVPEGTIGCDTALDRRPEVSEQLRQRLVHVPFVRGETPLAAPHAAQYQQQKQRLVRRAPVALMPHVEPPERLQQPSSSHPLPGYGSLGLACRQSSVVTRRRYLNRDPARRPLATDRCRRSPLSRQAALVGRGSAQPGRCSGSS